MPRTGRSTETNLISAERALNIMHQERNSENMGFMRAWLIACILFCISGGAVAAAGEPLKELEVGSYAEIAARPNPQRFVIQPIPALVAILLSVEKKKGSRLTKLEVDAIRDEITVLVTAPEAAKAVDDRRGYKDIDPSHRHLPVCRHR
jgi:hypothetical protein